MFEFQYLKKVDYQKSLAEQLRLRQNVLNGGAQSILGLEHPLVVTLGIRAKAELDLNNNLQSMNGVEIVQTDRGGQATIHNPGQLVIYPILDLKKLGLGAREYVELLAETTRSVLSELGIECDAQAKAPGVYVEGRKIASIGVRISHGVTSHGLSLNVSNNLEDFKLIRPCGVSGQVMTSLKFELEKVKIDHKNEEKDSSVSQSCPTVLDVFDLWKVHFLKALTPHNRGINLDRCLRV